MKAISQSIVSQKMALKSLEWLNPSSKLQSFSSTDFGRDIAAKIADLSKSHQAYQINLHRRPAAVVMGVDEYEKLLSMKEMLSELLKLGELTQVKQATDEFEELLGRIRSPKTLAAGDAFFSANGIDLATSFKPGRTESP